MNETVVIIVFGLIGYVAAFFAGYCVSEWRRLAKDHRICTDDGNRITEAAERIEDSKRRTEDLIGATESVIDIIRRYENSATEKQEMDNDMVNSNSDDID